MTEIPLVSVIDYNDSAREAVAEVIRTAGFGVRVFPSAETFIQSDQMACTTCLVIDVQLPGMSGLQLQSHLASAGRHIPIIFFVTTSADEKARALGVRLGAVRFQIQPSGEKALLKEIRLLLATEKKAQANAHDSSP